jgi:predicted nucleic acid-binding protein
MPGGKKAWTSEAVRKHGQFVLDCSVSAAWCFSDEKNDYVDAVLESFSKGYTAFTPPIWYIEMINLFRSAEKRSRLTRAASTHFIHMFSSLPISTLSVFEAGLDRNLLSIAGRYDLSAYDACYFQIAMEYAIPLATQDSALRRACEEAGVAVFSGDR